MSDFLYLIYSEMVFNYLYHISLTNDFMPVLTFVILIIICTYLIDFEVKRLRKTFKSHFNEQTVKNQSNNYYYPEFLNPLSIIIVAPLVLIICVLLHRPFLTLSFLEPYAKYGKFANEVKFCINNENTLLNINQCSIKQLENKLKQLEIEKEIENRNIEQNRLRQEQLQTIQELNRIREEINPKAPVGEENTNNTPMKQENENLNKPLLAKYKISCQYANNIQPKVYLANKFRNDEDNSRMLIYLTNDEVIERKDACTVIRI